MSGSHYDVRLASLITIQNAGHWPSRSYVKPHFCYYFMWHTIHTLLLANNAAAVLLGPCAQNSGAAVQSPTKNASIIIPMAPNYILNYAKLLSA
jgi:hypothetical protein